MTMSKLDNWKSLISEWKESGQNRRDFCQTKGVTVANFGYWRTKIRKLDNSETKAPVKDTFVRYNIPVPSPTYKGIIIEWPDGMKLRLPEGFKFQKIAELLRALKGFR